MVKLGTPAYAAVLGWSGGATVLGKLPVLGRPTIWITVGQWPTAIAVGAGGRCLDIFTLIYPFSPLSPSLWKTARYRLKYCLKGHLHPKQPTNQIMQLSYKRLLPDDYGCYVSRFSKIKSGLERDILCMT